MPRYCGKVGYATTHEDPDEPGIWVNEIEEVDVYGDRMRLSSGWQNSGQINDDLVINCQLSILMGSIAPQHYSHIKYATVEGVKWKVTSIEPSYPRLTLTLGGEWNGEDS